MEEDDHHNEVPVTLNVTYNKETIHPRIPLSSTVQDLKLLLLSSTNIPPCYQKLICNGTVLTDETTLMESGLIHGDTLMLLASHCLQLTFDQCGDTGIISLSHCHLEAFPNEVWTHGTYARVLDISYNKLKEVPNKLTSLHMLQKVNLCGNLIQNDSICWDGFRFLTVLSLKQNQLTSLPDAIGSLGRLVQLDISHNRLDRVPGQIGQLQQLQILIASNNQINYISSCIGMCTSLVEVDLSINLLAEIPRTFGELTELEALYLSYNQLRTLPGTLFRTCPKLTTLDVDGNEITDDDLRQVEGWEEFDERRVLKYHTQLDFTVPI